MPDEEITLTLPRLFVGQMLDALREEQADWEYTERYHLGNGLVDFDRLLKSDSNPHEARSMAEFYATIIQEVEEQMQKTPGDTAPTDVSGLAAEYDTLINRPEGAPRDPSGDIDWDRIAYVLERDADWTGDAARVIALLARRYGVFVVRNALALALVL